MKMLVGYTGFVGSNLLDTMYFDEVYNSKNIRDAYGKNPDLLIYAGVRGTKFLANKYPDDDRKNIEDAIENIKKINPKKLVLISTVDVYDDLDGKDEDYVIKPELLHTYGKNRYYLEQWVINNIKDYHIIRLPAIYGKNLKKNFVHDLINPIPQYLNSQDYNQIIEDHTDIEKYYSKNIEMYKLNFYDNKLLQYFTNSKYNAIRFTDSESYYQYYNLNSLHKIISKVILENIRIINCVTEKIKSGELYKAVYDEIFDNKIVKKPVMYDLKTKFSEKISGKVDGYLMDKDTSIRELKNFILKRRSDV